MPTYSYQAKSFTGKKASGTIEAESEAEARVKLRAKKLIPLKISVGVSGAKKSRSSSGRSKGGGKVKSKDLQVFTRQLSVLISSGVPLIQALEVLSQSPRGKGLDHALKHVVKDINEGKKLGASFAAHPKAFDKFYVNMLIAGEEGGVLDTVLMRLAEYIEKAVKLNGKIKGAMSYPVVVLGVSLLVVAGLLVFVIPSFVKIFAGSGMELPALTQLVMNMSDFFVAYWYLMAFAGVLFFYGLRSFYGTPAGKATVDNFLVRVPVFGDFYIKSGMARFSRTLSTMLTAGVSIMEALDISAYTSGNSLVEGALLRAKSAVSKGKLLSMPLANESFMPHMVVQMIAVGEQTGALDEMLDKVADFYEDEVDVAVNSITSLIEPLMIVTLGGIVAFFVIAMYLPIFKMASGV